MKQMLGIAAADDYSSFLSPPPGEKQQQQQGKQQMYTHFLWDIYLSFLYVVDLRVWYL